MKTGLFLIAFAIVSVTFGTLIPNKMTSLASIAPLSDQVMDNRTKYLKWENDFEIARNAALKEAQLSCNLLSEAEAFNSLLAEVD